MKLYKEATEKRSKVRLKMIQDPQPENMEEFNNWKKIAYNTVKMDKRKAEKVFFKDIE